MKKKAAYLHSLTDANFNEFEHIIVTIGYVFPIKAKKDEDDDSPFDDEIISLMNETGKYLAENIRGCRFGFVRSDEITLHIIKDENVGQLSELQSQITSMAASSIGSRDVEFDCKIWGVPTETEVADYIIGRQKDYVRWSKKLSVQTFLPKESLFGLNLNQQIKRLKDELGIVWKHFNDDEKFGCFIHKIWNYYERKGKTEYIKCEWTIEAPKGPFTVGMLETFFQTQKNMEILMKGKVKE